MATKTYADTIKPQGLLDLFIKHGSASTMDKAGRIIYSWEGWTCQHYPAKGIIGFYCPRGNNTPTYYAYEALMQI